MAIVNNFRRMFLSYDKQPPHLVEIEKYGDFVLYSSNFNNLVYVVYNSKDSKYYPFENNGSNNIIGDLKKNIETYFGN
ncbi:MAG: hypothetical protein V4560_16650 [Bacteroidota bacterium]